MWVRLSDNDRVRGDLKRFRIRTPDGSLKFLLKSSQTFEKFRYITSINRLYGAREVQISADLADPEVSASDANADIKDNVLPPILAKYPSIRVSYEGQNREQAKSQNSISAVMPLVFALMLFIIILTFRSPLQGLAVFGLIPFGLVGIHIGHWVLGAQISLFSVLGMIALIGILVNDALVFVAAYNSNLKEGMDVVCCHLGSRYESIPPHFAHFGDDGGRIGAVDAQQEFSGAVPDSDGDLGGVWFALGDGDHSHTSTHLSPVDQPRCTVLGCGSSAAIGCRVKPPNLRCEKR